MRVLKIPLYHLYLLQLENYNLARFWRLLFKRGTFAVPKEFRKPVKWTAKTLILILLCLSQFILIYLFLASGLTSTIAWIILFYFYFFFFLSLAVVIFYPIDLLAKEIIIWRAKLKIRQYPKLQIIGIAGSYGKTTLKEVLAKVLAQKFNVLSTTDNLNVAVGIARLIIKKLTPKTEILVIEMGEFYKNDIKQICKITPPDIAVVTGINEAHLERLKNLDNTADTIFEIVKYSKSDSKIILNADDENVLNYSSKFIAGHQVYYFSGNNNGKCEYQIPHKSFDANKLTQIFSVVYKNEMLSGFSTKILANYIMGDVVAALIICRIFNISGVNLRLAIADLQPVEHRLQPIFNATNNILVIDDSYNGNPVGVDNAIEVLKQFVNRRKIYLTPGLVEMGEMSRAVHLEIGKKLAPAADLVILIKNSATPFIAEGLLSAHFKSENIIWFNSALEAHAALKNILKPNDVILFQNDWGDNYL